MTKVDNSPGAAIGNLFKSIGNEAGRAVKEAGRHVTESINDITKAVETGGIVGGAVAFYDKTSLGNMAAGLVDSIIPGKDLPSSLVNGISAAVNAATGNPIALLDLVQGFSSLGKTGSAPAAGSGQKMQTPQSPSEAAAAKDPSKWSPEEKKAAVEAAKERGKSEGAEKAAKSKDILDRARDVADRGGGYAAVTDILSGLGDASMFFGSAIADITKQGKANDAAKKKLADMEKQSAQATAELDKILNNPNLSFEDMVFLLMGALMKQSQSDVKALTKETRDAKATFDATKAELNQNFDAKEAKVLDLEAKVRANPNDKGAADQLGQAKSELRKASEARNEKFADFNDSRQEQLEAIKNAMNKITEMQQTLSNILNSMHQTAMSTIGNIR
jgi:hypothetical protein